MPIRLLTTSKWVRSRFIVALILVFFSFLIGISGIMYFENVPFWDALYFHVITFSTVGFSELPNFSKTGKIFITFIILFNIVIYTYLVSALLQLISTTNYFEQLNTNRMLKKINELNGHIVICGFGRYGQQVHMQFEHSKKEHVIIDREPGFYEQEEEKFGPLYYVVGDATEDEILIQAGVEKASALISAMPDDADNLYTVLSARQINPKLKIISRSNHARSERKLKLAGANYVLMPEEIGGFFMATLVDKPGSIEFLTYLSREMDDDIDFEEISYDQVKDEYKNKSIANLSFEKNTGARVISYRNSAGKMQVNPTDDNILAPQTSLILLGTHEQMERINKEYLKSKD